jgi:hypothetical protein
MLFSDLENDTFRLNQAELINEILFLEKGLLSYMFQALIGELVV